jgi:hypothetical protein
MLCVQVKDDPTLLKKTIKKRQQQKEKSREKWQKRCAQGAVMMMIKNRILWYNIV